MYTPALKEKKGKDLKILSVTLLGRFVEFSCQYLDSTGERILGTRLRLGHSRCLAGGLKTKVYSIVIGQNI